MVSVGGAIYLSGRMEFWLTQKALENLKQRVSTRALENTLRQKTVNGERLARLSLWGKGGKGEIPPASTNRHVPVAITANTLSLKGIVRYPDGTFEAVFFDGTAKKTFVVRKGESLGRIRITDIQPETVVIVSNGKELVYKLFKPGKKSSKGKTRGKNVFLPSGLSSNRAVLKKKEVQAALNDMASFLRQVRIVPYMEKGKPQGFQLLDIVPGSIVDRVGLKNGDVIERVGGKPIRTPQEAMGLFTALQTGRGVTLEVKRGGKRRTITIDLE